MTSSKFKDLHKEVADFVNTLMWYIRYHDFTRSGKVVLVTPFKDLIK